ncbi:MAG: metallophosphoesterase family protein [Erysipelotrichaceae bacterium]|jgi:putative phosphoesterase
MKIIVMSDSHGFSGNVYFVMQKESDADYMFHLGDICDYPDLFDDLVIIKGNNDYFDLPDKIITEIGGLKFLMIHSHRQSGFNLKNRLVALAKENKCDIVLYGHTHVYNDEYIDGVRLLNPGSLYYNRDNSTIGYIIIKVFANKQYTVTRKYIQ